MAWVNGKWVPESGLAGSYMNNGQTVNLNQQEFDAIKTAGTGGQGLLYDNSGQVISNTGAELGFGDKFKSWFTPEQGTNTSIGGQVLGGVGAGVGALSGLAGMYFAKKNYDLQKDNQDYLRNREAQSDMRKSKFAANAGNNASY